jgi:hypothetical protein
MTPELTVAAVSARLQDLRRLHVPERIEAARERLARERPASAEPFAHAVARSLAELRALCELARYLHAARRR